MRRDLPDTGEIIFAGAKAALVALVLFGLPGWATISLARFRPVDLTERIFMAGAVGLSVGCFAHFALTWIHPAVPAAALLLMSLLLVKVRCSGLGGPGWLLAPILAAAVIGQTPPLDYLAEHTQAIVVSGYLDHLFHVNIIDELLRATPPAQMPWAAGEPFWRYH